MKRSPEPGTYAYSLARTCLHEGGHATVALRLGFHVEFVSAKPSAASRGICLVRPAPSEAGDDGAAVLLAGEAAAELLRTGWPAPLVDTEAPWLDAAARAAGLHRVRTAIGMEALIREGGGPSFPFMPWGDGPARAPDGGFDAGGATALHDELGEAARIAADADWTRIVARSLVAVEYSAVLAVADALGRHGGLEGEVIRDIAEHARGKPFPAPWRAQGNGGTS